tara:strand:- start:55198 stop:56811 length:1614 start_codon:yes stop_codon:yes gene_type:complete
MNASAPTQSDRDEEKPFAVKIFTTATEYDYAEPWKAPSVKKWTGSGFTVEGNKIITNAHVAGGAIFLEVQLANDSVKYRAQLKSVGHDCDLAILEVDDPEFWEKARIVSISETPTRREKVEVHGFPMGGREYCITSGIVSRTESDYYAHSEEMLLSTQVSAPINPGNSGGAVINKKTGEVVGVVHQGLRGGQNIGYMIPAGVLKHYIHQAETEKVGFPDLAISVQTMENNYLRSRFRMRKDQSGILVTDIHLLSSAFLRLKEGDVLMAINGHQIHNDGHVHNIGSMRKVDWRYLINNSELGDEVTFSVLRNGKECSERFTLENSLRATKIISGLEFGKPPSYFMIAGLICAQPVNKNYIYDTKEMFPNRQKKFKGEQLIAINTVLATEYTQGYSGFRGEIIERVNGRNIHNMNDLVEAVEENPGKNHMIELHSGKHLVVPNLSKPDAAAALIQYGIEHDRSIDLVKQEPSKDPLETLMGLDSQPVLFSAGSSGSLASKGKEKAPPPPVALDPNQSDDELDEWFEKLSIEQKPSIRPH